MVSFLKKLFIFNWRMIALQYYVGFCHTSIWISHRYTYVPSLFYLLPHPTPSHPSRLLQSLSLSFLSHTANSHWLFYTWQCICFYAILSIRPTLSFFPRPPTTISLSIHLLMDVWTVCTFWYIVNNAAVNMSIKVSVLNTCFQFFGHILRIKLMDLMVILCLPFWGNH